MGDILYINECRSLIFQMKQENYKGEVTCLRIRKKKSMVEPELESSVLMSILYRFKKKKI